MSFPFCCWRCRSRVKRNCIQLQDLRCLLTRSLTQSDIIWQQFFLQEKNPNPDTSPVTMYRIYQVKFLACNQRYRAQIMCGTASHHNHFFKPTGMPIINSTQCMTNPYNRPSCHAAAEQLQQHDAVAIREAVAALQAAAGSARSSPTRIVTSKKLQDGQQEEHHDDTKVVADDQLAGGGVCGSGCMNQICEQNCEECGLTLINWGWPGCHMLCPFLPRHPDALSTSTHCPQEEVIAVLYVQKTLVDWASTRRMMWNLQSSSSSSLLMMMMMMMNEEEEDYGYMTIVVEDDDPCVWDLAGVWNSVHLKLLQQ